MAQDPTSAQERKRLEEIKAAARAYALSSQTSTKPRSKKARRRGDAAASAVQLHPPPPPPPPSVAYHHNQHHHHHHPYYHQPPPRPQQQQQHHPPHYYSQPPYPVHHRAQNPAHGGPSSTSMAPPSAPALSWAPTGAAALEPPPARRASHGAPRGAEAHVETPAIPAVEDAAVNDEGSRNHEEADGNGDNDDDDDTSVDDDYMQFVKSLASAGWGADDPLHLATIADSLSVTQHPDGTNKEGGDHNDDDDDDDEEEEFRLDSSSDEEEEEKERGGDRRTGSGESRSTRTPDRIREGAVEGGLEGVDDDDDDDWALQLLDPRDLELELNWLEQEDMEAAVATLLLESGTVAASPVDSSDKNSTTNVVREEWKASSMRSDGDVGIQSVNAGSRGTQDEHPGERDSDVMVGRRLRPTRAQHDQLRELLQQHHQLLLQQSVLAARLAHRIRSKSTGIPPASPSRLLADGEELMSNTESTEDLAEILDAAVGMLQDLDQNRKDAIRHYVQFSDPTLAQSKATISSTATGQAQRALWKTEGRVGGGHDLQGSPDSPVSPEGRRLTRAQFSKALISKESREGEGITVFAIPGITNLKDTFSYIDRSVSDATQGSLVAVPTVRVSYFV
jgi:hypothetical protein